MEYVAQSNIKRLCNFYVSDLHLSVMLLPYISKQINEDVEITTIFEKLEKKEFESILEKINVKNKDEILNINWVKHSENTNDEINKIIKKSISSNKRNTIIIGGNSNYVKENNYMIKELIEDAKQPGDFIIINCYNIEETGINIKEIVRKYDGILNTSGEIKIQETLEK